MAARTTNKSARQAGWRRVFNASGGRSDSKARQEAAFGAAMKAQNSGKLPGMSGGGTMARKKTTARKGRKGRR